MCDTSQATGSGLGYYNQYRNGNQMGSNYFLCSEVEGMAIFVFASLLRSHD